MSRGAFVEIGGRRVWRIVCDREDDAPPHIIDGVFCVHAYPYSVPHCRVCTSCGQIVRAGDDCRATYRPNGCDHWYVNDTDPEAAPWLGDDRCPRVPLLP